MFENCKQKDITKKFKKMAESSQPTQLVLKSVNQLFDNSFFIPAYQRGYRWTPTQATQLLEDIWQFSEKDNKQKGEFYCLQPIVVTKYTDEEKKSHNLDITNDWHEVIDGQQRITTLYLIMKFLENTIKENFSKFSLQTPVYETRIDSKDFLENVNSKKETDAKQNVDFWHIWQVYDAIKNWFTNNSISRSRFTDTLLEFKLEDNIDVSKNVRVIWYEVSEDETNNHYDIFTRLNIGKIPLTNAELIKALFLQKGNFADEKATLKQIQIASEWDIIEKTLQDDAFWYFIYNPSNPLKYDNRIEYIFDLMKGRTKEYEFYYTYNEFYKDFSENKKNNKPDIDEIWLSIKQYFLTFEEWFKDYELFHYVGYLIDCGKPIREIKEAKEGNKDDNIPAKSKNEFKKYLKEEIKNNQVKFNIDNLDYHENKDKNKIRKVLLLFNIQTVLETQKSDMRFPFHKYKSEDWDIEHVRSQNDQNDTGRIKNPDEWANDIFDFFVGSTDTAKISEFIIQSEMTEIKELCKALLDFQSETGKNQKQENFNTAYKKVSDYFKESDSPDNINSISNLALLDATTNRSYGNAFFPIKRKRIIENDKNGIFVPICTKNLFLKYYSKKLGEVMYWNSDDANDYLQSIKETLEEFLPAATKSTEQITEGE